MKRRILVLVTVVLSLLLALGISTFAASAEEAVPSVTIAKFNLAFEDNTYLKYAVRFDGVSESDITASNIGMLYWTDYEGGFVPGTEDYSSATTGHTTISGVKHYVFEYTHLAAKQLTDYIYSVAYIELDGTTYYSEPVKYSALEYAYNRLGKTSEGSTNEELKALLNNMLAYGASAQQYFDYKEDRLATADYYQLTLVGGTLDDGFTSGLYLSTNEVTITAPEIEGKTFAGWKNSAEEIVSTDNPATVTNLTANTTLTATYEDAVKYSEGLVYTLSSDETYYYVTGRGKCTDEIIVIPDTYNGLPVKIIGEKAFYKDEIIKSIVIPDSVTVILDRAFCNCVNLSSASFGNSVERLGLNCFEYCTALKDVKLNENLYALGSYTFWGCTSLEKIRIPSKARYMSDAFRGCTQLKEVVIEEGVSLIDGYSFYGCTSLETVILPESVESIRNNAFSGCTNLKSINLPKNLKTISNWAFGNCTALSEIRFDAISMDDLALDNYVFSKAGTKSENGIKIVIGNEVERVPANLFYPCAQNTTSYKPSITTIEFEANTSCEIVGSSGLPTKNNIYINDFTDWCKIKFTTAPAASNFYLKGELVTDITIPDEVTELYWTSFYNSSGITSITIGDNITSIPNSAFGWCINLSSVVIGKGVTSIGYQVFYGCDSLTDIYCIGTEEEWATIIIDSNNTSLLNATRYYYSETAPTTVGNFWHYDENGEITVWPEYVAPSHSEGLEYTSNGDGTCYVSGIGTCTDTEVVIPTISPDGDSVTAIGDYAFSDFNNIVSLTLPDSMSSIGSSSLTGCIRLVKINVSDNSEFFKTVEGNLYSKDGAVFVAYPIGKSATEFVIPDTVTTIGDSAFDSCNLVSVVISDSVESIGVRSFADCNSLKTVAIGNTVTSIGDYAFYHCDVLETVVIPDSVKTIGEYAFYLCAKLSSVVIGNGVTDIELRAFSGCDALTTVVMGDSVTNVGHVAFEGCKALTDVYYTGTKSEWSAISFGANNDYLINATIHHNYVPEE